MADKWLEDQIAREAAELASVPQIPVSQFQMGVAGRCSFCGSFSNDLIFVEVTHGQERFKGARCCGGDPYGVSKKVWGV